MGGGGGKESQEGEWHGKKNNSNSMKKKQYISNIRLMILIRYVGQKKKRLYRGGEKKKGIGGKLEKFGRSGLFGGPIKRFEENELSTERMQGHQTCRRRTYP